MPFLQIGSTEVEVQVSGADVNPLRIGPVFRTYSGRLRSQVRGTKKVWEFQTPPLSYADADSLITLIGTGMGQLSGTWPGTIYYVDIEVVKDTPIKDDRELTTGSLRILTLRCTEDTAAVEI